MSAPVAARSNLLLAAALVSLLVLLLGATGLFTLSTTNDRSAAALDRIAGLNIARTSAMAAQISFKTQVQEWKNILLRGSRPEDYTVYVAHFSQRETEVQAHLTALRDQLAQLGLDAAPATKLAAEHTALGAAYRRALTGYQPSAPSSAFAVDTSIRGIDRKLNDDIDALALTVATAADTELATLRTDATSRYAALRRVTLILGALAMLTAFWLVFQTLRSAPGARAA